MSLELQVIDYTSDFYPQVLELRNHLLRKPLGLDLFDEDLSEDRDQYVVIALEDREILGCLMLKIIDKDTVKYRQMAVKRTAQGRGVGTTLIRYADNFCFLNDYTKVELHARVPVRGFYERNGFQADGNEFIEVGIPHIFMHKTLNPR